MRTHENAQQQQQHFKRSNDVFEQRKTKAPQKIRAKVNGRYDDDNNDNNVTTRHKHLKKPTNKPSSAPSQKQKNNYYSIK